MANIPTKAEWDRQIKLEDAKQAQREHVEFERILSCNNEVERWNEYARESRASGV